MGKFIDLTGKQIGRWTVLERVEDKYSHGRKYIMWKCKCSCNNHTIKILSSKVLNSGNSQSCGCLHKERMKEVGLNNRHPNIYDLTGDYGIGYTPQGEEFYFDLEDYDLIKNYRWYREIKGGYLVSVTHQGHIKMHNLIMGATYIDHINRQTNDNRKSNLRLADKSINEMNKGCSIRNKSGIVGVSYSVRDKKWIAQIKKGNDHRQKRFINKEEAIKQRLLWEKELFGEYSGQKDLWKEYNIE